MTSFSQTLTDPDAAYDLEVKAVRAMQMAVAAQ
jgi:hypothetical protein